MKFLSIVEQSGRTATGIPVPEEVIGSVGAGRKRFPVEVTIGGHTYRSTVGPYAGRYMLPLSAEHRGKAGVAAGDEVEVDLVADTAPREVVVPADLAAALGRAGASAARTTFEGLSYSHQNAYVTWIEEAKKAETRERRIAKAVEMLTEGRTR